jgi:hypothetical protein
MNGLRKFWLKRFFLFPEDFKVLFEGMEYNSTEELAELIKPRIAKLLGVRVSRLKANYFPTPHHRKHAKSLDFVLFSKFNPEKMLLIIRLKREKDLESANGGSRGLEIQIAKDEIELECQSAKCNEGILLTEKECIFLHYTYRKHSKLKYAQRFNVIEKLFLLDKPPFWYTLLIVLFIWIFFLTILGTYRLTSFL